MGYNRGMVVRVTRAYLDWINRLPDKTARARIQVRVDQLANGNPGDHRQLRGGVSELRLDFGPGYRVYFTQRGDTLIVILAGGDKSSQARDIAKAIVLAEGL